MDERKIEIDAGPALPADAVESKRRRKSIVREYAEAIAIAVLLALVIRSLVVQAFTIPSGSMMDTLLVGDYILVNKFLYGPELPLVDWRMPAIRDPQRGDIIVFRYPQDEKRDFILALAGNDTVSGLGAADFLFGQKGVDTLNGNEGADRLWGGSEDDLLHGGEGPDWLWGGDGADQLFGDEGNDRLFAAADDGAVGVRAQDRARRDVSFARPAGSTLNEGYRPRRTASFAAFATRNRTTRLAGM